MRRFTLMELLIVIAIIGILLTLLLPSLGKARQRAKNAICLSNTQMIATAGTLYSTHNNSRFPDMQIAKKEGRHWLGRKGEQRGYSREITERPLNKYLNYTSDDITKTPITNCPSTYIEADLHNYVKKGTEYYGNSYDGAWNDLEGTFFARVNNSSIVVMIAADGAVGLAHSGTRRAYWRPIHQPGKYFYPYAFVDGAAKFISAVREEGTAYRSEKFIFNLDFDN